ncbi:T9SS type A sorting domain-containing protein [Tenacibaculum ovolyticum]|uniref:T9SS type A sorting domain-containing protein n=1 Tax=Tenacibaculum ovolyticum TaxID=104270 RepID=UPI00041C1DAD|nr:T9SS type A sorting domain-containing protein [Tenacibaculum ovolyticum]
MKLIKTLCILFTSLTLFSQNFVEKKLPKPDNLSSLFIGPLLKSTIHYGAKPDNFNGKVILFNHGYIDLNQLFFTNNTFYQEAYNEGYQVVFVATTRGEGMWANGKLLAESIDTITNKYHVNDVYIIAHSNGGKASEVAMYTHKKYNKVKKVFALGTPYWGTYLADISQQWWLNWLWKKTGLNEGGATSTTYYCRDVVRPYFDNHVNNEPSKFIILGGSGFARGHTLLAPLMFASGSVLYLHQGVNDGVSPYKSTLRPNGIYTFKKNEAYLDHVDIALGQYVWKHIKPYLDENVLKKTMTKNDSELINYTKTTSDYQIINSENDYDKIIADKGNTNIDLQIFHENSYSDFNLKSTKGSLLPQRGKYSKTNSVADYVSNYTLKASNSSVLKGNSKFVAYAHQSNGPKMVYEVKKDENILKVSFLDSNANTDDIEVTATITKTSDLLGNTTEDEIYLQSFNYHQKTKNFTLDTSFFKEGVYTIYINSKHLDFTRNIISGFTVGTITNTKIKELNTPKEFLFDIKLSNTIITNSINIKTKGISPIHKLSIKIYTINGQLITDAIMIRNNGIYSTNTNNLSSGLYIATIAYKNHSKSFKIIKK